MGSEFTFFDYVDDGGANIIWDWFEGDGRKAKAKFNARLMYLEATPPGQWSRPYVDHLSGSCAGLLEIRAKVDVQYRLLGFFGPGPREVTLVLGVIKKGSRSLMLACDRALRLKDTAFANPNQHRREHDFG